MTETEQKRIEDLGRLYHETYQHAVRLGAGFDARLMVLALVSTAAALSHRAGMPPDTFGEIVCDAINGLVSNWGGEQHDD